MSVDKLYVQNCTLVEPTYRFLGSELLQNAFVFIDEFDASKERLIQRMTTTHPHPALFVEGKKTAVSESLSTSEEIQSLSHFCS